jgi:hypothetical protein
MKTHLMKFVGWQSHRRQTEIRRGAVSRHVTGSLSSKPKADVIALSAPWKALARKPRAATIAEILLSIKERRA